MSGENYENKDISSSENPFKKEKIKPTLESKDIEILHQIQEKMKGLNDEWYKESMDFIETLSVEDKESLLKLLINEGKFAEVSWYIQVSGYPNKETYLTFKKEFLGSKSKESDKINKDINTQQAEQNKEKTKEYNKENITLLKNIEASFQWNIGKIKDTEVRDLLTGIWRLNGDLSNPQNKELFESISKKILEKNGLLEKTLQEWLKIDRQNAQNGVKTNVFQWMSQAFSSFDPSLNARIEKFKLENDVWNLQTAQINATLGINSDKQYVWDFVYNKDRVAVDLSKNPPEAFMSSDWGYRLPLDMPVGEFYPATVKYEKARQNLEPQITTLNSAGPILQKAYEDTKWAESQEDKNAVISNLKLQLKGKLWNVYDDLNLDNKTSIKDIVDAIRTKRDALQKELTQAYTDYQADLKRISEVYAKSQQEKKDVMKSSLDFISSIGFDVVPQYITDMILGEINRGELGALVSEPIDIANGNFGIKNDDKKRIITDEKQAFIKLVNRMFSGNEQEPINILEHSGETNVPIDKMKLKEQLAKYGIFPNKEKWDINKIRENLRKQPVSNNSEKPS